MKKLFFFSIFSLFTLAVSAQEINKKEQDSTKIESLDEVILTTMRVAKDAPVTHSNVTKEDFEERNLGQDLPVLLNFLPSVVSTTDAGAGVGYTGIRVRGSDATRINVTLNGIPYNDSESQGTIWVNMADFASSAQSLQLQRGVGTSTNGPGAFGASLNILTDEVSLKPFGEISNSFGSYNTHKHSLRFSTGTISDYFELAGRLSVIKSDGYIDRAFSDLKSYYLHGSFQKNNTFIKLLTFGGAQTTYQAWNGLEDPEKLENDRTFNPSGMFTDTDGNIRFYENEVDNYNQDHYQILWNQRYDRNWTSNISLNYTRGLGYFEQYKENQKFSDYGLTPVPVENDTINRTDLIRRRWLDNHFIAANANVNYKKDNLEISGGGYVSYYKGDHYGEILWARYASDSEKGDRYYEGDAAKKEFSVFTKAGYRLNDNWNFFADIQGRFINYKTTGITSDLVAMELDENYSFFNPKAGFSYQLNGANQFYFSYGRALREPSRSDFREGILTPEKLDDFELGWRFDNHRGVRINTNIYYMYYNDQLVLSGQMSDTGRPLRTSSGESYRMGLEVDAEIQISPKFRAIPNITISSNKNIDFVASVDGELINLGKTNISFSPSVIAGNILEYRPVTNLGFGLLSKYVGEQYMGNIDSEKSKLDAYFVNDLNVTYRLELPWIDEVVFSALVNNIFDIKYISNGYFYAYDDDYTNPGQVKTIEGAGYFPQATRNFLLGATIKF